MKFNLHTPEEREAFNKATEAASTRVLAELAKERAEGKHKPQPFPRRDRFANSNFGYGF